MARTFSDASTKIITLSCIILLPKDGYLEPFCTRQMSRMYSLKIPLGSAKRDVSNMHWTHVVGLSFSVSLFTVRQSYQINNQESIFFVQSSSTFVKFLTIKKFIQDFSPMEAVLDINAQPKCYNIASNYSSLPICVRRL